MSTFDVFNFNFPTNPTLTVENSPIFIQHSHLLRRILSKTPSRIQGKSLGDLGKIFPEMSLGQKGSGDPGAMLTSILNKREKLRQELRSIEKQVRANGLASENSNLKFVRFHRENQFFFWGPILKNPSVVLSQQVYELETSYLQESSHIGNALKGFEGFLSSSKSSARSLILFFSLVLQK